MDAHEREAAAAAAGMQELYGSGPAHAVGDTVTYQLVGWMAPKVGQVEVVSGGGSSATCEYLIRTGDRTFLVTDAEILNV